MKTIDDEILEAMLKDLDDMTDEELQNALCEVGDDVGYAISGMVGEGELKTLLEKGLDGMYDPEVTIVS